MKNTLNYVGPFCMIVCAAFGGPATAWADTWGLTFFDQGSTQQLTGTGQTAPSANVQNSQQLSYSDSFSLATLSTTSIFSGMIDNAQLHAYSSTNFPSGGGFQGYSTAYNGVDEYWFDTFNFSPGTYRVNLVFDGTLTESVSTSSVFDLVDSFNFLENGTVIPGVEYNGIVATLTPGSVQSLQLSFSSPTSIVLGELLQIRNEIGTSDFSTLGGNITIDDSNTGYFTVTPLTTGAGFTTASGQTYSGISAVPEPSSLWLLSVGTALSFWRRRLRKNKG